MLFNKATHVFVLLVLDNIALLFISTRQNIGINIDTLSRNQGQNTNCTRLCMLMKNLKDNNLFWIDALIGQAKFSILVNFCYI